MNTIPLFNPDEFGISMAGITLKEDSGEHLLVVFRGKRIIFKKFYAKPEDAKRAFANRFKNEAGIKPLWSEFAICHNYKEKKEKKGPGGKA
jgi:hypothetical protein